ncbi:MAG: hypothetical protein FWF00_01155 [Endomicrobia bacterium]|nr:hypothetical protein [Endomicrobiia bacterium]MCL2506282.1 hypothetical protein [Endomicrobiia bacterium]
MRKIIFMNLPTTQKPEKLRYNALGNKALEYEEEVMFAINVFLAKNMKKEDSIKVVMLKEKQKDDKHYEKDFIEELDKVNKNIGASIQYVLLDKYSEETRKANEEFLGNMFAEIEDGVEVYADISFGTKPLPFLVFNALTFAEKYCNAKICNVIYGKKDWNDSKHHAIYDLTYLYYLNSLSNTITCKNSQEAKEMFNKILQVDKKVKPE